jgi:uncharacterized protein DUF4129
VQPLPPASGRSGRLVLVTAALVVLLAVVAFAARSGFGHGGRAQPNHTYVSYAFTLFLILFVLMIPVTIYAWIMRAREQAPDRNTNLFRRGVVIILFVTVFSLLVWVRHWVHIHFFGGHHGVKAPQHGHHAPGKPPHGKVPAQSSPTFEWTVFWVAVGIGVLATAGLLVLRQRLKPTEDTTGPSPGEELAAAIEGAIDDLDREPDPRRAVIAAYARMERELGRHGLPRQPSETAIEYLRRVLLDLSANGAAVERLTALFEAAKFSPHPVTEAMRSEAIAALSEIKEGLA